MGKNKKKSGNKQASEAARVVPVGLTITYSSSKQGNKKANATLSVPNVSPEVPAAASADSTSNRQQKKRNRGKGAGDGTRVVQEEAVKLQDQGVLQNVDDMAKCAEVSDTPQVFTDDPHWEDSNEDPPAVTPQKDSPPAVKNLNIEDVSNIPDLTTNSYQEDYSEETSLKDAHDLDSFEDPQAVTTKECDYVPSVETDSFQQQEMQQVPSNPYQMSSSSAVTSNKHNLNREASNQNPYHSSESSCAMNNRKQQHGKDSVGDWASDSPQDNGKNYNKGSGNNNRNGGDRPSDSSPYHNRKNYNKDSGYNNRSAGEWPRNSSPYDNRKSFNQGRGNDNRSFESKSWSRQGSGYKSRDENFRGNRSREGGSNEKWRNDNPRNEDHERGNQRYQRDFQNSNKDGEGKSNDRESYKRRNQNNFEDDNKDRRNRSREGNSNVWENKSHEASGSNNDQPDVSWGGGEVVADASWEGKTDGSWDIHIENQESSGHKDSRENRSDERNGQFWRDGSNRESRTNRGREGKPNWSLSGNENYHSQGNRELDEFWKFYKSHKKDSFKKVKEIEEDLFKMPPEYALAHCVAEDMSMGSGIAVQFSQQFKSRDELYQQRQKQGGLAVLTIKGRFIYYLVTKRISNGKPTMHTMWCSLRKLQQHMEENKVGKLAIPRIGCGLDRLEWSEVKAMIEYVFLNTDVEITVCNFQQVEAQSSASAHKGPRKCAVRNVAKPLVQIEDSTMVIYFGTEDGFVSEVIESLDTKFRIVNEYKTANRKVGEVVLNYKNDYALYGFIINKRKEDPFDFVNLQKCLGHLKKTNRQDKYGYVAFEAFLDEDDLIVSKICSVLRYSLYDVEVYVCWPGKLASFMPRERRDDYY